MATIKINNLNAASSDLFNDSESYLSDLTEKELENVLGGKWVFIITRKFVGFVWV